MHRTPLIKLEPEVVELVGGTPHQPAEAVLRVTNVSASVLPGLFFCLYNQEKFDIVPENFSLQRTTINTCSFGVQGRDGSDEARRNGEEDGA